jgi:hypothetical protein
MYWKKLACLVAGAGLLAVGFSSAVFACDNHHINEVTVQAPIDAVDCQATPATVTLLGLTIDVSNASFGSDWRHGKGANDTCSKLTVGKTVAVNLESDTPDAGLFTATEVDMRGHSDKGVIIAAPLTAVDSGGGSVTALGLVVDISKAALLNDRNHPIDMSQLKVDQFAAITLPSNQTPLAAKKLQVRINQVEVQAPVDSTDCAASPATISVLGLNIDVSKATFGPNWHHGKSGDLTCANLTVGQTVDVYLTGDTPDATGRLTATEVEMRGDRHSDVKIAAPLQVVDPAGTNVTVLGLAVDISKAILLSDKEEPITASQLKMGQFAGIALASSQAPLAATALKVHIDEVIVQAPLDVVDCQATPPTVSMLGLTIDISKASFGPEWRRWHGDNLTCADLTVGQVAAVELVSDLPDQTTGMLTATEVEGRGDCKNGVKIAAPLQAIVIDPSGNNVTVLGLVVDISKATLRDDNLHTITPTDLAVNQFVGLKLANAQTPLTATQLVAESGIHAVHVLVRDEKGKLVNDAAADVKAEVTVTIAKKVHKIQTTSNGAIHLAGLPAGRATIVVTRVHDGKTSKATATFMVKAKGNNKIIVKLKPVS